MNLKLEDLSPDLLLAAGLIMAARLATWIFYANTVRKTMSAIREENRFFRPNQAWLLLVPLFNVYWNFVVARNVSNSLTNEFFDRKIAEEENPGQSVGLSYAWMFMLSHIPFPPVFLFTFTILSILYFVQYWVKVNNFRSLLLEHDRFLARQRAESDLAADAVGIHSFNDGAKVKDTED